MSEPHQEVVARGGSLASLQQDWDGFGKDDPLWRILSLPDKKGGKWTLDEFFETGRKEIDELLDYLKKVGLNPARGTALDFGCGVGRLTQGLARHFDRVKGVDISPSMIDLARQYNRFGDHVEYFVNARSDLRLFPDRSFDLIYSSITLQHVPPQFSRQYIADFVRVLRPGGAIVFQLPHKRTLVPVPRFYGMAKRVFEFLPQSLLHVYHQARYGDTPFAFMYGIPRPRVRSIIEHSGGAVVDIRTTTMGQWTSCIYCATTARKA